MTYIILGAILATIGLSFISGLQEILILLFELIKSKLAIKISINNALVSDLVPPPQDEKTTPAIGFTISEKEDEYDD